MDVNMHSQSILCRLPRLPEIAKFSQVSPHPDWLADIRENTPKPYLEQFHLLVDHLSHPAQRLPQEIWIECPVMLIAHTLVSLPHSAMEPYHVCP